MDISEGSFGRSPDRSERFPNKMFKYNRANFSYQEMFHHKRKDGDLFAVFQDDRGQVRVEYATQEDYEDFAMSQIERAVARRKGHGSFTNEDFYMLITCAMISRIHDYDFENFIHLIDHDLNQVLDMNRLIEWANMNSSFFSSPVEDAVLEDAEDQAGLLKEYDKMAGGGGL